MPVTVIEAGPNPVTARARRRARRLRGGPARSAMSPERKLTKAELGHLKKAGAPPSRHARRVPRRGAGGADRRAADRRAVRARQRVKVSGDRGRQGLSGHDQAPQLQPRPGHPRLAQRPRPRLDRRQRRPGPRLQGHADAGPDGRQAGHPARPRGRRGRRRAQPAAGQGRRPGPEGRHGGGAERWPSAAPKAPDARQDRRRPTCPQPCSARSSTSRWSTRPRAPTSPRAAAAPPRRSAAARSR